MSAILASTVSAVIFADDRAASDLIRATGETYQTAGQAFFITTAAAWLYLGDDKLRAVVRDIWADSKHASREYALKIARACKAAEQAGKVADIRAVSSFRALAALGKKAPVDKPDAAPADSGASLDNAVREEQDKQARAKAAAEREISRMADIANALAMLEKQQGLLVALASKGKGNQALADIAESLKAGICALNLALVADVQPLDSGLQESAPVSEIAAVLAMPAPAVVAA